MPIDQITTASLSSGLVAPSATTATTATSLTTASGSAPSYSARAWVNFNGTGTVAIRASGNVSSITDNGTGNYTVNFTTAMPDENYSVTGSANFNDTASSISDFAFYLTGTTGVRVLTHDSAGATLFDAVEICASIFR